MDQHQMPLLQRSEFPIQIRVPGWLFSFNVALDQTSLSSSMQWPWIIQILNLFSVPVTGIIAGKWRLVLDAGIYLREDSEGAPVSYNWNLAQAESP